MTHLYGKKSYWDERYKNEGATTSFDWYGRYAHFKTELQKWLKKSDYILVLGCGNSRMAEELFNSEFTSVANIDFSEVVIKQMAERHAEKNTLSWKVMDVTVKLDFPPGLFDVCIDKACLDCVLCGDSSTNQVANALYNVIRSLKPQGVFLLVSFFPPSKWLGYLEVEMYNWKVTVISISRPVIGLVQGESRREDETVDPTAVHYLYVCEKQGDLLR
jgi:SAM-dependent methyltransferase